jgi:D-serine deaminase-like pyridoxal phosphate-dependent protein
MVAFPVNVLEIEKINALAIDTQLHLLVEALETVFFLEKHLTKLGQAKIWIKVDTGYHRTGLEWNQFDHIIELTQHISQADRLRFQGILTHSGHTYHARSKGEIQAIYTDVVTSMRVVQGQLGAEGFEQVEISIGDTPSCSVTNDFSDVDEIRPGNFVFYDVMQMLTGACDEQDIAVAVACPVVARHPERSEFVIYGGAAQLSKEMIKAPEKTGDDTPVYGYVAAPVLKRGEGVDPLGWGPSMEHTYVTRISQEHGIVKTTEEILRQIRIGDVVLVLPVHSCLTANLLRKYVTLEGEAIPLGTFS